MNFQPKSIVLIFMCLAIAGCRKKADPVIADPPANDTREVHVNFANFAGSDSLKLNTGTYINASGESFTVSMFNYYISNIRLIAASGNDYVEKESYHLVRHGVNGSMHFHLTDVPQGDYKAIRFLIGVDSARNVSGSQSGALDVNNGMFWTWNTGYIMAKMEGKSDASNDNNKNFKYHPGGFSGPNSVLRTVQLDFPATMALRTKINGDIVLKADILKWFAPQNVSIAQVNSVMMPGPDATKIADNYAKMFSIITAATIAE